MRKSFFTLGFVALAISAGALFSPQPALAGNQCDKACLNASGDCYFSPNDFCSGPVALQPCVTEWGTCN